MKRIYENELKSLMVKQVSSNGWVVFVNEYQVTNPSVKSVADEAKMTVLRDFNWHGSILVNDCGADPAES